ncbi:MAG: 23S rRNA (guanosine2251-2'-O)-methyltransferase [Kiritimatiellia bacterium]|jgi:23S rRNA (guanosine2251-2'-O)-methyltransferase
MADAKKTGTRQAFVQQVIRQFHVVEGCWEREGMRRAELQKLQDLLARHVDEPFLGRLALHVHPAITLPQLCTFMVPVERELHHYALRDEDFMAPVDAATPAGEVMPARVILDNLRGAFNVGGVFRTAECFGFEQVICSGYTATPEHPKVLRSAMGAEQGRWESQPSIHTLLDQLQAEGVAIIALETGEHPSLFDTTLPFPCAWVLGNERFGIGPDVLAKADHIVHIPMVGIKNSINVVSAFAIAACETRRQWDALSTGASHGCS